MTRDEIMTMDEDELQREVESALGIDRDKMLWNWTDHRYSIDIAAAYELEDALPEERRDKYAFHLNWIINRNEDTTVDPRWQFAHASPADRCRAWLLTMNNL